MNLRDDARRELDSVVINIELTLVSIIQGVALFFLTDNARALSVDAACRCVCLHRGRIMRDLHLLVALGDSHTHTDPLAT